jgi:hypothetical protein
MSGVLAGEGALAVEGEPTATAPPMTAVHGTGLLDRGDIRLEILHHFGKAQSHILFGVALFKVSFESSLIVKPLPQQEPSRLLAVSMQLEN